MVLINCESTDMLACRCITHLPPGAGQSSCPAAYGLGCLCVGRLSKWLISQQGLFGFAYTYSWSQQSAVRGQNRQHDDIFDHRQCLLMRAGPIEPLYKLDASVKHNLLHLYHMYTFTKLHRDGRFMHSVSQSTQWWGQGVDTTLQIWHKLHARGQQQSEGIPDRKLWEVISDSNT